MQKIKLALVSVNQSALDLQGNNQRMIDCLHKVKNNNYESTIVCFPELSLSGADCADGFLMPYFIESCRVQLESFANQSKQILPHSLILVGLPIHYFGFCYNSMAIIHNGSILGFIPKEKLFKRRVKDESRWFYDTPVSEISESLESMNRFLIEYHGLRVSVQIGQTNVAESTLPPLQSDLILNPIAGLFEIGEYRQDRIRNSSLSQQERTIVASVNLLGNEAGQFIYDGCRRVSKNGELLHESDRFSFRESRISEFVLTGLPYTYQYKDSFKSATITQIIKIEKVSKRAGFSDDLLENHTADKALPTNLISISLGHQEASTQVAALHDDSSFQEFNKAMTLALYDYMRKSGNQGYTVSLSGGADSATCALLIERMVRYGTKELGSAFFEKANLEPVNDKAKSISSILFTIYQKTNQNNDSTEQAANELAKELNSTHYSVNIQPIVTQSTELVEALVNRKFEWQNDDLTLQNIQSRTRSPIAWMLANSTNTILISTGNRNESSVGYCTIDGDTSGGLAPIAGIDKPFIQSWLRYMEEVGDEFGQVRSLSYINSLSPSAELRPKTANQTDETDLMAYSVLERIERLAIQDKLSPIQIFDILLQENIAFDSDKPQFNKTELQNSVDRFFTMWRNSQWKRERSAVSFHIDKFDVSGFIKFPVISQSLSKISSLLTANSNPKITNK